MEAFKTNLIIFLLNFADEILDLSCCSLDLEEIFVSSEIIGFSCSEFF
jgi:hypothetical protein